MSIEFRYLAPDRKNPDQQKEYILDYFDGGTVPGVQFPIDELPTSQQIQTRNFNITTEPVTNRKLMVAEVNVEQTAIVLANYQHPPYTHKLRHVVFEKTGLSARVNLDGAYVSGKIFPLK
jgi:ribosomal protein L25 (general stress protein Ctc)